MHVDIDLGVKKLDLIDVERITAVADTALVGPPQCVRLVGRGEAHLAVVLLTLDAIHDVRPKERARLVNQPGSVDVRTGWQLTPGPARSHITVCIATLRQLAEMDSLGTHRRMRDPAFRASQIAGVRQPHIAPINDLVDELRMDSRGWVPYVAPIYGGVDAEVLHVFRAPGPMTNAADRGSGFLCLENDDPAAERLARLLDEASIGPERTITWNAYPWYINRKPSAAELDAGVEPLRRLLTLLPGLRVVLLHGGEAKVVWRKYTSKHALDLPLAVLPTYHTSRQAFIGSIEVRGQRLAHLRNAFAQAARAIGNAKSES